MVVGAFFAYNHSDMGRKLVVLFLAAISLIARGDDPFLMRGLSARFIIVPIAGSLQEGLTYQVRLELTDHDINGSAGPIPNPIRLELLPDDLHLRVVDDQGRELTRNFPDMGMQIRPWNVEIPPNGRVDFPIGEGGDLFRSDTPGSSGKLLTIGLVDQWVVPSAAKGYYLSGTLHEDRPDWFRDPRTDSIREWQGSVEIPKVPLP